MAFLSLLLPLPLLLTIVASSETQPTPQQLSCPSHSWLEEELSFFLGPPATPAKADASPEKGTTVNEAGAYAELTESALQFALDNRPLALVLYSNARCTETSSLYQAFVAVARAFGRLSLLEPRLLFAKVVPDVGGSSRTPGMRKRGGGGCELLLCYKQQTAGTEEDNEENVALPLPESSTEQDIKLQIIKLVYPPSLLIHNKELLDQVLYEFPRSLVRFFPRPADITPVSSRLLLAATQLPILDVYDPSLAALYHVKAPQQLLLGPRGFRETFALDPNSITEQLRLIQAIEAEPATVLPLTSLTAPSIFTEIRPVVFFFGGAEPAIAEDFAFTEAAASWGKSFAFCSSIRPSALQSRAVDYLGIRGMSMPKVVIVNNIENPRLTTKFICPDISSVAAITQCLTDFKDKKLAPYYKSAAPPTLQKGPVYELVASRFNAVVLDSTQEVLLLVYSPACPHSAIFMPVFEELAIRVANEESLLVARLDGTANEVEGLTVPSLEALKAGSAANGMYQQPDPVSVHGYPVVVFFAKKDPQENTKVRIVYTGPRNADALRNFVISQTALQAHEDL